MTSRGRVWSGLLAATLAATSMGVSGCGDGSTAGDTGSEGSAITTVKEWIVRFATDVGEFVMEKAKTFGEAVARAWNAFQGPELIGGVEVDDADPLRGRYSGILRCEVAWGAQGSQAQTNSLAIRLDHPLMVRESTETSWVLAPQAKERIETLRDELLHP